MSLSNHDAHKWLNETTEIISNTLLDEVTLRPKASAEEVSC